MLGTPTPDTQDEASTVSENLPGVGLGDFVRMILVLGLVIALVYGFFWLLKRLSSVRAEGEDAIRLISTRPLKGDAALHLVETGNRLLLVGTAGNSINLITEITDKEFIDELRLSASQNSGTSSSGFSRLFRDRFGLSRKERDTESKDSSSEDPAAYIRHQKERLKDL